LFICKGQIEKKAEKTFENIYRVYIRQISDKKITTNSTTVGRDFCGIPKADGHICTNTKSRQIKR
jgi:hypothetical protein